MASKKKNAEKKRVTRRIVQQEPAAPASDPSPVKSDLEIEALALERAMLSDEFLSEISESAKKKVEGGRTAEIVEDGLYVALQFSLAKLAHDRGRAEQVIEDLREMIETVRASGPEAAVTTH